MDAEHDLRPGQVEKVGIAREVPGVVSEALARVVLRRQPGSLDHRPPGAVEHDNALAEKGFEAVACVRQRFGSRLKMLGSRDSRAL